jgi:hypothetical protein
LTAHEPKLTAARVARLATRRRRRQRSRTIYEDGTSKNTNSVSGAFLARTAIASAACFRNVYPFDDLIAEVLVHNRLLSDIERATLRRYLGNRYGVTVS